MLENINHSFIVRIWIEPREIAGEPAEWKGMIQHVVTGRRSYFTSLEQLSAFICTEAALDSPDVCARES